MKLAFHFDARLLGGPYDFEARRRVFAAFLAQGDRHIDSRILSGDLLFGQIPDRKSSDVVGIWFFPQNPVWVSPLRDPLILPYEINKTKPFLNRRTRIRKFARWRTLN